MKRFSCSFRQFADVAKALDFSRKLKVAMFGSNMRQVAVTDGDRVESQIRYGWEVNYYGIGDLVAHWRKAATDANRLKRSLRSTRRRIRYQDR